MMTPDRDPAGSMNQPKRRAILGNLGIYNELIDRVVAHPGLLAIEADPLSGTSGLLALLAGTIDNAVLVDARGAVDAQDLGERIADAAIATLRPAAASWWRQGATGGDIDGLHVRAALLEGGVDTAVLFARGGRDVLALEEALRMVSVLGGDFPVLIIDHLDALLQNTGGPRRMELISVLRAYRQSDRPAQLVLAGRSGGHLAQALTDPDSALYHAGATVKLRRPTPERFVEDLAIGQSFTTLSAEALLAAAELAEGAPGPLWTLVDFAGRSAMSFEDAWAELRRLEAGTLGRVSETLGAVHRLGPTIVAGLSLDLGPYRATPGSTKVVYDGLRALQAHGVVWSPVPRSWRIADPLLRAWARASAPPAVRHHARLS